MRAQRQTRASSMHSTVQSSYQDQAQMTSSKTLLNSSLQKRNNNNQSALQQQQYMRMSQQSQRTQGGGKNMLGRSMRSNTKTGLPSLQDSMKKPDDEYISKLHTHINFLTESVNQMKGDQQDYKSQMMNMMQPHNDNQVVDHAIETQSKFKNMKQKLIVEIHQLQNVNNLNSHEIKALTSSKQFLDDELEQQNEKESLIKRQTDEQLENARSNFQESKRRREERDNMVYKLQKNIIDTKKEFNDVFFQRKIKLELEEMDNQVYQKDMQVIDTDLDDKKQYLNELQKAIDKQNQIQAQDKKYEVELDKREMLQRQLEDAKREFDIVCYDSDVLQQNINYGNKRKEEGVIEYQNLKTELEKYRQIKGQIDKRNEQKVQDYLDNHKGFELRDMQKDLQKTQKRCRELKLQMNKLEKEYRDMVIFIIQRELKLNDINEQIAKYQLEYDQVSASLNSLKVKHDEKMGPLTDDLDKQLRFKKEQERLLLENIQEEQKRVYLLSMRDSLQEKVSLEEEMRKIQVDQLKSITYDNEQFNSNVNHFYSNWGNMQKFGKGIQY